MTVTSMSKEEFVAKYDWLNSIASALLRSQSKSGIWSERNSRQRIAIEKAKSQGYYVAWREQIAIENNPVNIARWQKEAQLIIDIEEKRLSDIRKEEREFVIYTAGIAESQRLQKVAEDKRLQQIKDQEITFNEQTNSGDFNETPITDVNVNSGCSECTGTDLETGMTNDQLEKEPLNYMKIAGITAIGLIGLMVVRK